jgi:fibronectin type 3 domain-containing protein
MSARRVRRPVRPRSANARSLTSQVERLESRELLSALALPTYKIAPFAGSGPPSGSFTPAQIQEAYQFNQVSFNGSGETIAIVDAYNDPDIQSDLNTFDSEFSLPSTTVSVVNQTGGSSLPGADPTGGWEVEESLDVEWAHAMAPGANILLVEASSAGLSDLLTAVKYASQHANVVSMSWGSSEFSGETSDDSYFDAPGVAFVVASGDSGAPANYPAASPNVLGVGGTTLTVNSSGDWVSETGWGDSTGSSTGGPSADEPQPSYQTGVVTQTSTARATPDVAYDAGSAGSYAVYDSYPDEGETLDWVAVWGTSAGAPQWSAILAIADQGRAANVLSPLNSSSDQQVMDILYQNPGDFHDITTGTSLGDPEYSAGPGYDYVTGLGTPMVNLIVGSLDGSTSTPPPDTIVVSAPSSATAGDSFRYTVAAENPTTGSVDTSFTGTIRFTSTDSKIQGLPSTYTFTTANDGVANFTVTLETAGSQTITETSASGSVTSTIMVSPATASKFVISGLSTATVGTSKSFTVTADDAYGNVATGYTGTVEFTSSDTAATLPGNTPFTSADAGIQTFSVTFGTPGTQSLTVTDTGNASLTATQSGISVSPTAPLGLAATAVSSSQINLTWHTAAGATGYDIERSLSASSGFAEVGTATTTSYSDTGLTAGTTYYYQVIATGGGISSAASNTASATTTGTAPPPPVTESIWGTSYSPKVNSDYDGEAGQTFELGVQFESDVAGLVTGVLFYKQSGTTGTNVAHLWSSNGTLLSSATFTNESSSGWQEVSFSSPVAILANTIYTVSYDTGGPLFYYDSEYFASGGVTNGNLTAPQSTTINGEVLDNGVYNYGGEFPTVSQYYANFWVDVAFSPLASTSAPDKMVVSAPSSATAGTSFTYTVTAENPTTGSVDTSFMGTIQFTSTDSKIQGLPSTYMFTTADAGVANFTVTLETAGSQKITETSASGSVTSTIVVSPGTASKFVISGLSTATVGTSESFTVTADDPYGNVATGYTGTVEFTSSDTAATLPANTPFTAADAGTQTFSVAFGTAGTQSLTVTDTGNASLTATQSGISVSPAAPLGLAATAVSSSQINLTWHTSAGASGYEIERSLSASSGFAEVATATTTSYSDTGLTAGTTYYYQVIATGGGNSSAASNTASATTTGTAPPPTTDSIWGTSYSPKVNSDYDGEAGQTFELGVQFESNVAGQVTGVLFYKQRGTTGTNVAHLWSSTGTLLASATFTNETSSGWQKVSFATPVAIEANTIYTVSYDTGSPLFYYESEYFASGGVTNGNLTAPQSTTINGKVLDNGVYNYGGEFPGVSQYYANFWVDVAFSLSAGSSASGKTAAVAAPRSGPAAVAIGLSGSTITSAASATPAGPMGTARGSQGTSSSTARRPSVSFAVVSYRLVVRQARAVVLWGQKETSLLS